MKGALAGLTVLDFSTLLPGPMATLFLADAGAEVIKVERPGRGEEMRSYAPAWGRDGVNFAILNRGKKSIALDLKDVQERDRLIPLIERADILVEQFRPGVMERLGLGFDVVHALNPRLIYCSITGYGQTGPKSQRAGHDLNYIGDTGLLALSLGSEDVPVIPPALIADIAAGTYPAVFNILMALRTRDSTGEGCHLDIAMADNLFPFMYWALGQGQATGIWPGNADALVTGGSARYRLYPTADEKFAAVAAIEDKFWQSFCTVIGLEAHLTDDGRDPAATIQRIGEIMRARPSNYWDQLFEATDCCCTIVRSVAEAHADPHFAERGLFEEQLGNERGAVMAALPTPIVRSARAPASHTINAPALGEHNDEVLGGQART